MPLGEELENVWNYPLTPYILMCQEWGLEGYHLWMIGTQCPEEESGQYETVNRSDLIQMQFVKSCLTVNPCMVGDFLVYLI